jgi:hypothetical protein
MKRNAQHWIEYLISFAIYLFLAGCVAATPEPLTADEILSLAIDRTSTLRGFECSLLIDGPRAYVDPDETIAMRRIDGIFVAPDKLQATIRVISPGLVTEFQIVSLGEAQWFTNLITGEWEVLPAEWGFYPASLFEPETGIVSVLRSDITNLVLEGIDELEVVPGVDLYHLVADMSGNSIYYVSYGLITSDELRVELWVEPGSYEVHRIILTEYLPMEPEPRVWTIDFWGFDRIGEISPPELRITP